ncbi:flagellar hook capping FlgD N-terminal domain-containing protein [Paenibacillus crassostreae]|uniref:Flagellar hook capping protein n=1 Tax=Paenibacillus crassostreae TaxID=1763538 RepID=A0A167FNI4_9BACL|nr:flagellar hook capping FlgD N-terminal domain-containing protein [Paenibacillus crassostreae]AOZ94224.1 flagellar hook capping protein [Paenibacillus crassostreae]OAB76740.1 flagellar hook capping protein [Paenibacillus crassostreae]
MASDIISTSNIWPNYSASNVKAASTKDTTTMGKDQFLKIMITQLQNQDPMQPLEDKEFIAQMAQFTSVEQLMNISTQLTSMSQSLGNVSGIIGKEISWIDSSEGSSSELLTGIVDSIVIKDSIQYATVGDSAIPLDLILKIGTPEEIINPAELASESNEDLL